jgi:hypothetical protein
MKKKALPKQTASWLIMVQKNSLTKDLFVDLPSSLVNTLGWTDSDSLIWTPQSDGSFKVTKVEKKKRQTATTTEE